MAWGAWTALRVDARPEPAATVHTPVARAGPRRGAAPGRRTRRARADRRRRRAGWPGCGRRPPRCRRRSGGVAGPVRYARTVAAELADPLTPVLATGAAATAVLGEATDAVLVGSVTVGNALISGFQRLRAETVLESLLLEQEVVRTARSAAAPTTAAARTCRRARCGSATWSASSPATSSPPTPGCWRRRPGGRRVRPDRRVAGGRQGRAGDARGGGRRPHLHALRRHDRRRRPRPGRRRRRRARRRRPGRAARAAGGAAPPGRRAGAARRADPVGAAADARRRRRRRRAVACCGGRPLRRRSAGCRGRGRRGARGAAAGGDGRAAGRRPPAVPPRRGRAQRAGARGARPGRHRLLRQDRHADREPAAGGPARAARTGRRRRRRAAARWPRSAGRPGDDARRTRPTGPSRGRRRPIARDGGQSCLPFTAGRGFSAGVRDGRLVVKGAPEVVLDRCADAGDARDAGAKLAAEGLRVLAVADRAVDGTPGRPRRRGARTSPCAGWSRWPTASASRRWRAIEQLRASGVRVLVATGDHPETASRDRRRGRDPGRRPGRHRRGVPAGVGRRAGAHGARRPRCSRGCRRSRRWRWWPRCARPARRWR